METNAPRASQRSSAMSEHANVFGVVDTFRLGVSADQCGPDLRSSLSLTRVTRLDGEIGFTT